MEKDLQISSLATFTGYLSHPLLFHFTAKELISVTSATSSNIILKFLGGDG